MVKSTNMIPTNKVSTDNAAVNEAIRETSFRSVKDGVEGTEERVLYLHTEPQYCRFHCRKMSSGMRVTCIECR